MSCLLTCVVDVEPYVTSKHTKPGIKVWALRCYECKGFLKDEIYILFIFPKQHLFVYFVAIYSTCLCNGLLRAYVIYDWQGWKDYIMWLNCCKRLFITSVSATQTRDQSNFIAEHENLPHNTFLLPDLLNPPFLFQITYLSKIPHGTVDPEGIGGNAGNATLTVIPQLSQRRGGSGAVDASRPTARRCWCLRLGALSNYPGAG